MKIRALCAIATIGTTLIAQNVCAAPPPPASKAASTPTMPDRVGERTNMDSTTLAAAAASRRDVDPELNGTAKDWRPPDSALAKR